MADPIQFIVDPGDRFKNALTKAINSVNDLTIPLQLISRSWFKSNMAFFALKGPGKFVDLAESTKLQKDPDVYPILRRSGALEKSITDPTDGDAISIIVNKTGVVLGTRTRYAPYLHFGTKKMPARPFVMIGAEQTGPDEFNQREQLWINTIASYVVDKVLKKHLGEANGKV